MNSVVPNRITGNKKSLQHFPAYIYVRTTTFYRCGNLICHGRLELVWGGASALKPNFNIIAQAKCKIKGKTLACNTRAADDDQVSKRNQTWPKTSPIFC